MGSAGLYAGVAALAAATVLAGTGVSAAPAAPGGWRDGGRICGPHESLLIDSSAADVLVAVCTTGPSFDRPRAVSALARRKPNGTWTRTRAHLGQPVGVHVNARGHAIIVSVRRDAVVAASWRRAHAKPRTRVILTAADAPAANFSTRSVANGRGDVAVLLTAWPGEGNKAVLLRKPLAKPWSRALTIGRPRYGGALDAVDIRPKGAVIATFKSDQTLSVRTLPLRRNRFGAPTSVTTWAAIDDSNPLRESFADVMAGRNGDLATTWDFARVADGGGSQLVRSRLTILPEQRRRWQRQFSYADDRLDLLAVARDGAVLVDDGTRTRRWNPVTRRLQGRGTWHFKDANTRGDALIGAGLYRGPLRLWPVGRHRGHEVRPPAGRLGPAVLTAERRVYLAVADRDRLPTTFRLRIRRF
jgi:hypothetical protein